MQDYPIPRLSSQSSKSAPVWSASRIYIDRCDYHDGTSKCQNVYGRCSALW